MDTSRDAGDGILRRPSWWTIWYLAARPKTLWTGISPVIVGSALAWHDHAFVLPAALAALVGAIAIQVGTNFANDLSDHLRGADGTDRLGPTRATQAGWVTPAQMRRAVAFVFALAFLVGIYLVFRGGWPVVAIGLCSLAAAWLYTGGPYPFGYHGLGDIFVFIFFGPVAVVGTYYVQTLTTTSAAWQAAIPMGAWAAAVLCVNNLRDIESDRRAGKRTLAVRLGRRGAVWEYAILILVTFLTPIGLYATDAVGPAVLAASAVALLGIRLVRRIGRVDQGVALNEVLAATARSQLLYALVFAGGVMW
ncbi:MAG: 1,4-dihydroxy-2-naphthoate polyprenyltransferase [Candidatus Zixiibacteriota bacterium]